MGSDNGLPYARHLENKYPPIAKHNDPMDTW